MERLGRGFGKLLLFGEHSVLYGQPAIGLSLPQSVSVRARASSGAGLRFEEVPLGLRERLDPLLDCFDGWRPDTIGTGWELALSSDLPVASGFGSSAALCVALANALAPDGASSDEIWAAAHRGERQFHGTPSGIDTALALYRGLCAFNPAPAGLPVVRRLAPVALNLVAGALPREGTTASHIESVRATLGHESASRSLESLGAYAREAIEVCDMAVVPEEERARRIGALASAAHASLRDLGLSTKPLDALLERGIERGATGGKLSGAGGGGAFFLVYRTFGEAAAAAEEVRAYAASRAIMLAAQPRAYRWPQLD